MRRNRKADWSRRLVREATLTVDDLIWPMFLIDGEKRRDAVPSMPGVERLSVDEAVRDAERAAKLGIPAIALFPYTDPARRDPTGSEALNPDNLVCTAARAIKAAVPNLGVIIDVALDPYTSHGHDGLLVDGEIVNDATRGATRAAEPDPGGGRRRHHRPLRHDGRAGRRDPPRARRQRVPERADHGLRGEVRLGVLRALPRRGRLRQDADAATSAPTRWTPATATRRCARSRSTSRKAPT